jgi:hypothetical protein
MRRGEAYKALKGLSVGQLQAVVLRDWARLDKPTWPASWG